MPAYSMQYLRPYASSCAVHAKQTHGTQVGLISATTPLLCLQVDYVEPWLAGNARGPSTAFCLLYKLCELKPTEEEVRATINHEDSVYIRAVRTRGWF